MSKFIPTAEQKKEAAAIAKELGVSKLYITKDGHFFTEQNRALLNVGNVKDDVVDFEAEASSEVAESPELKAANKVLGSANKAFEKATQANLKAAEIAQEEALAEVQTLTEEAE
jgi:hypothetical protein